MERGAASACASDVHGALRRHLLYPAQCLAGAFFVLDEGEAEVVVSVVAKADAGCGVTQPRINYPRCGRMARSSHDSLVNIAAALGRRVRVTGGCGVDETPA